MLLPCPKSMVDRPQTSGLPIAHQKAPQAIGKNCSLLLPWCCLLPDALHVGCLLLRRFSLLLLALLITAPCSECDQCSLAGAIKLSAGLGPSYVLACHGRYGCHVCMQPAAPVCTLVCCKCPDVEAGMSCSLGTCRSAVT